MLAAAVLVRRTPDALFRHIEYVIHPQANQRKIFTEILAWADARVLEKSVQYQATYTLSAFHDVEKKGHSGLLC